MDMLDQRRSITDVVWVRAQLRSTVMTTPVPGCTGFNAID
jgi:hypothetical protein